MIINVVANSNCQAIDSLAFSELEKPRPIRGVKGAVSGRAALCDVAGWTLDNRPGKAYAVRVRDSGDGQAVLIFGQDAGLRFRPADPEEPWDLKNPRQWGEPYRVVADESDLVFI